MFLAAEYLDGHLSENFAKSATVSTMAAPTAPATYPKLSRLSASAAPATYLRLLPALQTHQLAN